MIVINYYFLIIKNHSKQVDYMLINTKLYLNLYIIKKKVIDKLINIIKLYKNEKKKIINILSQRLNNKSHTKNYFNNRKEIKIIIKIFVLKFFFSIIVLTIFIEII